MSTVFFGQPGDHLALANELSQVQGHPFATEELIEGDGETIPLFPLQPPPSTGNGMCLFGPAALVGEGKRIGLDS